MAKFYVGQRVKVIDSSIGRWVRTKGTLVGKETRISGPGKELGGFPGWYYWPVEIFPDGIREDCLVPITDPNEFESFMEKVMKPVKLDEPVSA